MEKKNKHILVPVDFSEISLVALDQSCNMAETVSADVTILVVIESHSIDIREVASELRTKVDELVAKTRIERPNLKIKSLIETGKVYQKIIETSEILNVDFIIMGTNGSKQPWRKKVLLGSNALRVVRVSTCPVITIKGVNVKKGCDKIVLPLDLSEESREKVNPAIELAHYFKAEIHICTVIDSNDSFIINKLESQVAQVEKFIKDEGVNCHVKILKGYQVGKTFADTILNFADSIDADLIVIMSQEELGFTGMFLGKTAQEIIHSSEIPVCSIGPETHDDQYSFTPY